MGLLLQKEGVLTTMQGLGIYGEQRFGINPRGAMDKTAVRLINTLLGNADGEPVLEMHFPAAEIILENACVFALGGADFGASLNGNHIENWTRVFADTSSVLKFAQRISGNRSYLAVKGGFRLNRTDGGSEVRLGDLRLKNNDHIDLNLESANDEPTTPCRISNGILPVYSGFPTVRILAGGEFDFLSDKNKRSLVEENFVITNNSNRMGYRLDGPHLNPMHPAEMVSSSVSFGTIQLLPDGQLIVLMADHQTSGGYPRIANVISVDLPLVAQLGPKDKIAFKLVDIDEAERIAMQFESDIQRLRIGCRFGRYW